MRMQVQGKTRVNLPNAICKHKRKCKCKEENCPFSYIWLTFASTFASHMWTRFNANASKWSVTGPPSWKKGSTAPAYLMFLVFAFYVWTLLAFTFAFMLASHLWTRLFIWICASKEWTKGFFFLYNVTSFFKCMYLVNYIPNINRRN